MKTVTFKYEDIQILASIINSLPLKGFENAKLVVKAGNILDSGIIKELPDKEKQNETN